MDNNYLQYYSHNELQTISHWFIKGFSILIENFEEFSSDIIIRELKEIDNKIFTANGLFVKELKNKDTKFKFPIASSFIDSTELDIFTLQPPKISISETCMLLRSQNIALKEVLTSEEILQAEDEFVEAIQSISKKYTNIIHEKLLLKINI